MSVSRIPTDGLADGAVATSKLADANVTKAKLAASVAASDAEVKAASLTDAMVTPGRLRRSPYAAKAWVVFDGSAGTPDSTKAHAGVSSITDNGVGDYTINWANAFASTNYAYAISGERAASALFGDPGVVVGGQAAASLRIGTYNNAGNLEDYPKISVIAFGELA